MLFNKRSTTGVSMSTAGWISSLMGSSHSHSGQIVTHQSALAIPVLQACVSYIAESIGQLPLELYKKMPDGGREVALDHPLYPILKYAPNERQTSFEYREGEQLSLGLRGNSYTFIDRNDRGEIVGLEPLDPDKVQVLKGQDLLPYYRINGNDVLPKRLIHHIKWMSFDSYVGISPIMLHANTIGYMQALSEYAGKSFLQGTALSGVLERPREVEAIKEQSVINDMRQTWENTFGGTGNARRVAILQEGMTFKPLTMSNVDSELISALKLSDADISRMYKVPLPLLSVMEGATMNNMENLQTAFVVYCLMPWVRRHEQAKQRDFLLGSDRSNYYIEFNVSGLMRGNQQARYQSYAVGRQWGWLSINDIRRLENMPPIDGGDTYLQPLNMVDAANSNASPPPPSSANPKDVDAISEFLK